MADFHSTFNTLRYTLTSLTCVFPLEKRWGMAKCLDAMDVQKLLRELCIDGAPRHHEEDTGKSWKIAILVFRISSKHGKHYNTICIYIYIIIIYVCILYTWACEIYILPTGFPRVNIQATTSFRSKHWVDGGWSYFVEWVVNFKSRTLLYSEVARNKTCGIWKSILYQKKWLFRRFVGQGYNRIIP